jgi:hypothetical protein
VSPTEMTGRTNPLPIMIEEDIAGLGGRKREIIAGSGVV